MLGICELQTLMIARYHVSIFATILSVALLLAIGAYNTSLAQHSQTIVTAAAVQKPSNVHNTSTAELSYAVRRRQNGNLIEPRRQRHRSGGILLHCCMTHQVTDTCFLAQFSNTMARTFQL